MSTALAPFGTSRQCLARAAAVRRSAPRYSGEKRMPRIWSCFAAHIKSTPNQRAYDGTTRVPEKLLSQWRPDCRRAARDMRLRRGERAFDFTAIHKQSVVARSAV